MFTLEGAGDHLVCSYLPPEDFVVVSLRDVTPVAGQGGGVTSDGSRPSSTSGESESDVSIVSFS